MSTTIDIDKAYVSPYDLFLREFDATHPKTESQRKEIEKHRVIALKRDDKEYHKGSGDVWSGF